MRSDGTFEASVLGRRFRVEGARAEHTDWFRRYWQITDGSPATRFPHVITIRFARDDPRAADAAPGVPVATVLDRTRLTWHRHGARTWSTTVADGGVRLTITDEDTHIDLWQSGSTAPAPGLDTALHVAIVEALRATTLTPLHAAVVVRADQAIALLGQSGVGKSTTVLGALAEGWTPLSEDLAWLDPVSGLVYGWDRGIRITEPGAARFRPHWQQEGWTREADGKLLLPYARMPGARQSCARLTRIALLQRDPSRASCWDALDLRTAVRALYESAGVPLCPRSRATLAAHLAPLLIRLERARLILGHTALPF